MGETDNINNKDQIYEIKDTSTETEEYDIKEDPETTGNLATSSEPSQTSEASGESEPEIYGVSAPEPRVLPSTTFLLNQKEAMEEDRNESDLEGDQEEKDPLSLEEIYARKQKERDSGIVNEMDSIQEELKELPNHPFWNRLFIPFFRTSFFLRFMIMVGAAFIPFFFGTHFFVALLEKKIETSVNLGGFISCLLQDRIILFLFCFLWGIFSLPYSIHIFDSTSNGDDNLEDWPEYNVIGGISQLLWVLLLILIAGTPGYFLFMPFGSPVLGFTLSAILLLPIFFLSAMESDTLFTLCTKGVGRSLLGLKKAWGCFYTWSVLLFVLSITIAIMALWFVSHNNEDTNGRVAFVALILSFLFTVIPILYLRILGRLAWMISDYNRILSQAEDEEEEE